MTVRSRAVSVVCLSILMAGCAVGPDFERPETKATTQYGVDNVSQLLTKEGDVGQAIVPGKDISAEWWRLFESDAVNQLVENAILANPDMQAAEAALRSAAESALSASGSYYPWVSGENSVARQKTSGRTFGGSGDPNGSLYNLYNSSVGVSYTLDLWGGTRRMVEALDALEEYARFQKEAAYLTLTSNAVTAAIQAASLQAQQESIRAIVDAQSKQLDIIQKQNQIGTVSRTSMLAQTTLVEQTRAELPQIDKAFSALSHQIDVIAGRTPGETKTTDFKLDQLHLPKDLPLSVSSQLLEQRPDIKAAEALVHSASASVGVAIANMLPQVTLSATTGSAAQAFPYLFNPGASMWGVAGSMAQPIFHGGQLWHKKHQADAELDKAIANYKSVVLGAFQNVADALRALQYDTQSLKSQKLAESAATENLAASRKKFEIGAISYPSLLMAEQSYQQTRISYIKAQAALLSDTVALYQALGGGWWNKVTVEND